MLKNINGTMANLTINLFYHEQPHLYLYNLMPNFEFQANVNSKETLNSKQNVFETFCLEFFSNKKNLFFDNFPIMINLKDIGKRILSKIFEPTRRILDPLFADSQLVLETNIPQEPNTLESRSVNGEYCIENLCKNISIIKDNDQMRNLFILNECICCKIKELKAVNKEIQTCEYVETFDKCVCDSVELNVKLNNKNCRLLNDLKQSNTLMTMKTTDMSSKSAIRMCNSLESSENGNVIKNAITENLIDLNYKDKINERLDSPQCFGGKDSQRINCMTSEGNYEVFDLTSENMWKDTSFEEDCNNCLSDYEIKQSFALGNEERLETNVLKKTLIDKDKMIENLYAKIETLTKSERALKKRINEMEYDLMTGEERMRSYRGIALERINILTIENDRLRVLYDQEKKSKQNNEDNIEEMLTRLKIRKSNL